MKKLFCLSSNAIKLLAVLFMTIDHIGFFFDILPFRYIGRLAFPLFAYAIAEGCRYTKNKRHHFALLFGLGMICQVVYYIADPTAMYLNIFLTFSLSVLLIYLLQYAKECSFAQQKKPLEILCAWVCFGGAVLAVKVLTDMLDFDYDFFGVMLPVFVALFDTHRLGAPKWLERLDIKWVKLLALSAGMACLTAQVLATDAVMGEIQKYSFFALVPLVFYNEKPGKFSLKYFFYLYYPLHMALLQVIYWMIYPA